MNATYNNHTLTTRHDPKKVIEILSRLEAKESAADLASQYGVTASSIRRWAAAAGVDRRGIAKKKPSGSIPWHKRIDAYEAQGMTHNEAVRAVMLEWCPSPHISSTGGSGIRAKSVPNRRRAR